MIPALSATCTVIEKAPLFKGVPLIVPLAPSVSPAGRDPAMSDHVYGGDPPLAVSVCEYAVPRIPVDSDVVVMLSAGGLIVSDSAAVAETDALSVTFTVKLLDPTLSGVPVIVPPADRVNPEGSAPLDTDHEYPGDPPLTLRTCEYIVPTTPAGSEDVVTLSAGGLIVNESAAVAETDALSVTLTVKLLGAAVFGVPEIVPPVDRVNPEGSDPLDTVHE